MRVEVDGLTVARGRRRVLTDVSAVLEPGTVTVILGPNGAGKSTLLETMAGLLSATAGDVRVNGASVAGLTNRQRARAIGYLAQGADVHWNLKVSDVVALGRQPHIGPFAGPSDADTQAVTDALHAADLVGLQDRLIRSLSGGERARVLLARVLAGRPDVLLADEPLANLDPRHQAEAMALFRAEAGRGTTIVLVLHDLQAAARHADQIVLLAHGHLLQAGPPAKVLTPAYLADAYGVQMLVRNDPELGFLVIPR